MNKIDKLGTDKINVEKNLNISGIYTTKDLSIRKADK